MVCKDQWCFCFCQQHTALEQTCTDPRPQSQIVSTQKLDSQPQMATDSEISICPLIQRRPCLQETWDCVPPPPTHTYTSPPSFLLFAPLFPLLLILARGGGREAEKRMGKRTAGFYRSIWMSDFLHSEFGTWGCSQGHFLGRFGSFYFQ